MIHVIATIELNVGCRDAFLGEFHHLAHQVLAEEGCVEYGAAIDIATSVAGQIPERPHVVTVVEKWESLEHLKKHLIAPHMGLYREKVRDLVIKSSLMVLEPA